MAVSVTEGKSRLKVREASPQTITDEQIETFFATLAETCNVVRAAKAAGFTANWAYRKRKRDAAFRNGWAAAVREGYAKLELVLLERAMKGTTKPMFRRDGSERIVREYSTALAVALLRRHAETADSADYDAGDDEMREVRDRILEKLQGLKARALVDGGVIETKAAMDRVGLISWALRRAEEPLHHVSHGPPPLQKQGRRVR